MISKQILVIGSLLSLGLLILGNVSAYSYPDYDKTGLFPRQPEMTLESDNFFDLNPSIAVVKNTTMSYLLTAIWFPFNMSFYDYMVNPNYYVVMQITYPNGYNQTFMFQTETIQPTTDQIVGGVHYWVSTFWKDIRSLDLKFNQTGMYRFNYLLLGSEWEYWFGIPFLYHMAEYGASNIYYNATSSGGSGNIVPIPNIANGAFQFIGLLLVFVGMVEPAILFKWYRDDLTAGAIIFSVMWVITTWLLAWGLLSVS